MASVTFKPYLQKEYITYQIALDRIHAVTRGFSLTAGRQSSAMLIQIRQSFSGAHGIGGICVHIMQTCHVRLLQAITVLAFSLRYNQHQEILVMCKA